MKTSSYKDLVVWQKSMNLVEQAYELTAKLPASEKYGLASQIQRAATSIPSNISEGYKRHNLKEYIHFCGIAAGSAAELETQFLIVGRVYPTINPEHVLGLLDEVQRMLHALIRELRTKL